MATKETYEKLRTRQRQNRYFSEEFKRKKVKEIERNLTTVSEISREYQVTRAAVYKWIYKYSHLRKKGMKQVVEAKSDTGKLQQQKAKIRELEQIIGQKQVKIDFLEKLIEVAEEELGIAIKKKSSTRRYDGSGLTEKNTPTK